MLCGKRGNERHREGKDGVCRGLFEKRTHAYTDLTNDPSDDSCNTERKRNPSNEQSRVKRVVVRS